MGEGNSTYGRYICQLTTGCEIRFVTEGDRVQLSLSSFDVDGFIHVFRGDFKYATYRVEAGKVNHFMLTKSPQFEALPAGYKRGRFSPDVWRILSGHDFGLTFVDIEPFGYRLRPPLPEEKPDQDPAGVRHLHYPRSLRRRLHPGLLPVSGTAAGL